MRNEESVGRGIARHRGARNANDLAVAIAHHLHIDLADFNYDEGVVDLVEAILWCNRGFVDGGGICYWRDEPHITGGIINAKTAQGEVRNMREGKSPQPRHLRQLRP